MFIVLEVLRFLDVLIVKIFELFLVNILFLFLDINVSCGNKYIFLNLVLFFLKLGIGLLFFVFENSFLDIFEIIFWFVLMLVRILIVFLNLWIFYEFYLFEWFIYLIDENILLFVLIFFLCFFIDLVYVLYRFLKCFI